MPEVNKNAIAKIQCRTQNYIQNSRTNQMRDQIFKTDIQNSQIDIQF